MAEYLIQSETLDAIADAINAKTGGSSAMTPAEMVMEIGNIPTGGGGEVLLASGEFTISSSTVTLEIPVSFTGVPVRAYVVKNNVPSGVSLTWAWLGSGMSQPSVADSVFNNSYALIRYTHANGNTGTAFSTLTVSSTEIACGRYANAYPITAGTYEWYIWGYEE